MISLIFVETFCKTKAKAISPKAKAGIYSP